MGKKKAVAKKAPAAAPAAPAAAGANTQVLPKKEDGLFKELIRLQESKQYKKAIKTADTVLKKFPEHGETNAMKGLVYNSMGEKDKAYELAKLGVRYNIKSAVCWHVYGMIYRSDKNYKEAIKCFQMAVRFNPNNLQIVRELSVLQIQIRDMPGFTASRLDLVRQQGGLRSNWLGYRYVISTLSHPLDVLCKRVFTSRICTQSPKASQNTVLNRLDRSWLQGTFSLWTSQNIANNTVL